MSHTARIIDLRAEMAGTADIIIGYHFGCFRLGGGAPRREQWLFLRRQTRPRSEGAWRGLRSLAGCTKRWRHGSRPGDYTL